MTPDVLERLLTDRSLGRLEPDVDTLLADFLADNPAATAQAKELQDVVQMATKAVRSPVPVAEIPNQIPRFIWRHRAEQVLALAASFVIGIGIAALFLHTSPHAIPSTGSPVVATARPNPVNSQIESLPFWSTQRAFLLASTKMRSSE